MIFRILPLMFLFFAICFCKTKPKGEGGDKDKQLSEEETKKICLETMKKVGASSVKDMGKVMGALKKEYSDVLDFSKVSQIIKENLK